jgi:restriction system protein
MNIPRYRANKPSTDDPRSEPRVRQLLWAVLTLAAICQVALLYLVPDCANAHQCPYFGLAAITQLGHFIMPALLVGSSFAGMVLETQRSRPSGANLIVMGSHQLARLSWQGLEKLATWYFRSQGYVVERRGGMRPDGGIDLVIRKDGLVILVQCKLRGNSFVGVKDVRELYGVVMHRGSGGGILITAGGFSDDAVKFAEGTNLKLISGHEFVQMLENGQYCERHGVRLELKVARPGTRFAGRAFLGCPHRDCNYRLPLE